jgi:hypothetical protein
MQRFKGRGVRSFSSKWDDNVEEGAQDKCIAKWSTGKTLDLPQSQRDTYSALSETGKRFLFLINL